MIDIISRQELRRLAGTSGEHCVSIYLPTHRAGGELAQDPIRLKNLLAQAHDELTALGVRAPQARELLASVEPLQHDRDFWAHLEEGLAVFVAAGETRVYRLPQPVEELVVVADHLHLKPLLPFVASGESFYVLTLSHNRVRLLRGSRYRVSELALAEIPESLEEALWFDDRESQLHSHGAARVGTGRVTATFHGHGVGRDTKQADLERFLGVVDDGVRLIVDDDSVPLVLAGVDATVATYRKLSHYPNLVEEAISGSAEELTAAELHDRAWPLVADRFDRERREAAQAVLEDSVPSVYTVPEAVVAAAGGRVASVFVPLREHRWGTFDPANGEVAQHDEHLPGDRDLLDVVAVETLTHGGLVFAGDVPGPGPVAAALRY